MDFRFLLPVDMFEKWHGDVNAQKFAKRNQRLSALIAITAEAILRVEGGKDKDVQIMVR